MRVVVVGADAAGASAASTALRRDPSLEIVMFERGEWTSYSACGFPYALSGEVQPWDALVSRPPEEHRRRGIDTRILTEVTAIDTAARRVEWRDLESGEQGREDYDVLVYATGAGPWEPPIAGLEHGHFVFGLRNSRALDEALRARPRSAVVVGGGYVGVEIAETLRSLELAVTLITRGAELMSGLDAEMGARVRALLEQHGVGVQTTTELTAIERRGERRVALTSSGELEADVVVLGLGSRPAAGLAAAAGIPLGESGAVTVDHHQRTRIEGVYAAGDCAEAWHHVAQRWVNLHLGTVANKSGRIAGINVAGGDARFPGVAGTAIVRAFDHEVARTGLSTREAAALGIEVEAQTIESHTASDYMPNAEPMGVRLVIDRGRERIVGGQIVGGRGAGKRIDVIAMACVLGLSPATLLNMDLAYAPPLSPVWDPVQTAARVLAAED